MLALPFLLCTVLQVQNQLASKAVALFQSQLASKVALIDTCNDDVMWLSKCCIVKSAVLSFRLIDGPLQDFASWISGALC